MPFERKTWQDRQVEYPGRRKLTATGTPDVYDVSREEGVEFAAGDPTNAANFNDLEGRVDEGFAGVTPTTLTASFPAASWLPMTQEEIAATDPALTVKQEVSIPNLTATQRVDIVRVPVAYEADGQPSLYPYNLDGVCIICAAEAPTIGVDVILSVQEVVTL